MGEQLKLEPVIRVSVLKSFTLKEGVQDAYKIIAGKRYVKKSALLVYIKLEV